MTIASKLFFYRRTRPAGRISEKEEDPAELDPHRRRLSRQRRGGGGSLNGAADHDDLRDHRRPALLRHHSSHLVGHPENESFMLEKRGSSAFATGTGYKVSHETSRFGRSKVIGVDLDDRLPISVLQARARLVEKLKSVHLTESRNKYFSAGGAFDESKHAEGASAIDSGNWKVGTSSVSLEPMVPVCISLFQMDRSSPNVMNDKPRALSASVQRLKEETFFEEQGGAETPKSLPECSICLDLFSEGQVLIRLQCNHRFHQSCLEPWIQSHGVCPYCRSSVVNQSYS